jgi:hypothetical protein
LTLKGVPTVYYDVELMTFDIIREVYKPDNVFWELKYDRYINDGVEVTMTLKDRKEYQREGLGSFPLISIQVSHVKQPQPYVFEQIELEACDKLRKEMELSFFLSIGKNQSFNRLYTTLRKEYPDRDLEEIALAAIVKCDQPDLTSDQAFAEHAEIMERQGDPESLFTVSPEKWDNYFRDTSKMPGLDSVGRWEGRTNWMGNPD